MKILISVLSVLLFLGCGSTQLKETPEGSINGPKGLQGGMEKTEEVVTTTESSAGKMAKEAPAFATAAGVGEIISFLASDDLQGRDSGSEGIAKAADYIETIFKKNNVAPFFTNYRDTLSNFPKTAYNMVGVVEGTDPVLKKEYILIGAHYDHIGMTSGGSGDTIANGANDNASGTTTVLELARYFGNAKTNKRSIIFALFSAEEQGLLGSEHLAKKLKAANLNLYAMLNYEMVGVPMVGKDYFMYITGYEKSNLAKVSNSYSTENLIGFLPTAKGYNLFQRSDNYPFHTQFGVPSHTYCTFDFTNFDHYHGVGDEVSLMDFDHMATVVNKSIPMLEGILNAAVQEIVYE